VADARPTIADLRNLVRRAGANNDLTDATLKMPGLERLAAPALRDSRQALVKGQPVLEFIRPYAPDLVGWIRDFGQSASNYDANGHFARIEPIVGAFSFTDTPGGGTLSAISASARLDDFQSGMLTRCPGAASQPPPDKSAPYVATLPPGACDPSEVPPGP
jgi:phospholipid/cholesterol/gamma-HCH transport system substrate-binding protein